MKFAHALQLFAAGAALAAAVPALADVKAGVDAWSQGDYAAAVREWRAPAAQGDPDAQFNMAQAYRLGRGVEQDRQQAEILYAKAAAQGHIKAADNYGLMLFEADRREEAMPFVLAASDRGDPRAQYLLGIARFNGDMVEKDWVRAYALLTLANSAGLPQANPAIRQMDEYIPLEQRQEAQLLARQIKQESDAARAQQLAAADLALGDETTSVAAAPQRKAPALASVLPKTTSGSVPTPIAETSVAPSIAAAQAAIAEASRVTGTSSPAEAGADYARPRVAAATAAPPPPKQPASEPESAPRQAAVSADGPWRVQLGAFSVAGNADRLWREVSGVKVLAGKEKQLVRAGGLTRLRAGGFATRGAARAACDTLKAAGRACLVTR